MLWILSIAQAGNLSWSVAIRGGGTEQVVVAGRATLGVAVAVRHVNSSYSVGKRRVLGGITRVFRPSDGAMPRARRRLLLPQPYARTTVAVADFYKLDRTRAATYPFGNRVGPEFLYRNAAPAWSLKLSACRT
jgi:hypothetical protein